MFIGRETELAFLQDKYNEKRGQLIVLYGRRRVGMLLIHQIVIKKIHLFATFCSQDCHSILVNICRKAHAIKSAGFSFSNEMASPRLCRAGRIIPVPVPRA